MTVTQLAWILLADSRRARLVRCTRTEHDRCHVEDMGSIKSDAPQHEHKPIGPVRKSRYAVSGVEGDDFAERARRFARQLRRWVELQMNHHDIRRLNVFCPARFLGPFREVLPLSLRGRIRVQENELVNFPCRVLADHKAIRRLIALEKE